MTKQLICAGCGSIEKTKREVKGNLAVEIVLWLCFIIPGLIYSLWRQGTYHNACAVCGGTNLIPLNSPVGQKLLKENGMQIENKNEVETIKSKRFNRYTIMGFIIFFMILNLIIQTII